MSLLNCLFPSQILTTPPTNHRSPQAFNLQKDLYPNRHVQIIDSRPSSSTIWDCLPHSPQFGSSASAASPVGQVTPSNPQWFATLLIGGPLRPRLLTFTPVSCFALQSRNHLTKTVTRSAINLILLSSIHPNYARSEPRCTLQSPPLGQPINLNVVATFLYSS